MKFIHHVNKFIGKIEKSLIILCLASLIVLAFFEVAARLSLSFEAWLESAANIHLSLSIPQFDWSIPFMRILVLWIAFIGASIATMEKGHIRLDILSKFLPDRIRAFPELIVHILSFVVLYYLITASWAFISDERIFPTAQIGAYPSWYFMMIVPINFSLIALRHLLLIGEDCHDLIRGPGDKQSSKAAEGTTS